MKVEKNQQRYYEFSILRLINHTFLVLISFFPPIACEDSFHNRLTSCVSVRLVMHHMISGCTSMIYYINNFSSFFTTPGMDFKKSKFILDCDQYIHNIEVTTLYLNLLGMKRQSLVRLSLMRSLKEFCIGTMHLFLVGQCPYRVILNMNGRCPYQGILTENRQRKRRLNNFSEGTRLLMLIISV